MNTKGLSTPVSSIELDKIYRIMLKRESLGYSARDLSFLLGYHALYVSKMENPTKILRYNAKDTNYLLHIFDCDLEEIMSPKIPEAFYKIKVETSLYGSVLHFKIYKQTKDKAFELLFEYPNLSPPALPTSIATAPQIKDFVQILFEDNFFEKGKTALEIFKFCAERFGKPLSPSHVSSAISRYTSKRKAPRLIKVKNSSGRFVYQNDFSGSEHTG